MSGEMDPINAGLWALAGFDKTCGLLADLREDIHAKHANDVALVRSIDTLISVYLEYEAEKLTRDLTGHIDEIIAEVLPADSLTSVVRDCAALTDKPLLIEISGYAMHLAALSNYGQAPWRRFAAIIDACVAERHAVVPA